MEARYDLSDTEPLLEHMEWVRRLAERLVGDPAEADDLRQEVWLLARRLEGSRLAIQTSTERRWLGKIVRTLARNRRRAARTRSLHEASAGEEAFLDREDQLRVSRVSAQSRMVELLLEMDEPYRTALLQRYFDGLTPTEIAHRTGTPLATVKSRLHRGLARLRELAQGDRLGAHSTLAVVAWLQWREQPWLGLDATKTARGGESVQRSRWAEPRVLAQAAGGAALVAGLVGAWGAVGFQGGDDGPAAVSDSASAMRLGSASTGTVDLAPVDPVSAARQGAPDGPSMPIDVEDQTEEQQLAAADSALVSVVEFSGEPCLDAEVRLVLRVEGQELGNTDWEPVDGRGRVELVKAPFPCVVEARAPGRTIFATRVLRAEDGVQSTQVVMVGSVKVSGRVVDGGGVGIAGARIMGHLAGDYRSRTSLNLAELSVGTWNTSAGPDGRFDIVVPWDGDGPLVGAHCPGFEPLLKSVHPGPGLEQIPDLVFQLEPAAPWRMYGTVLRSDGTPASGAFVADGNEVVRAGPDGRFEFFRSNDARTTLRAGVHGAGHAALDLDGASAPVLIQLPSSSAILSGRVVDGAGQPIQGLQVTVADPTWVGTYSAPSRGRLASVPMSVEMLTQPDRKTVDGFGLSDLRRDYGCETDRNGRFELKGLEDRTYDLVVQDRSSLAEAAAGSFPAGSRGVELLFDARAVDVSVQVVNAGGERMSLVRVQAFLAPGGYGASSAQRRFGPSVVTDGEGRGTIESLAAGTHLIAEVEFPWMHSGTAVTGSASASEAILLRAEPAARVVLIARSPTDAPERLRAPTKFRFLDETGEVVPVLFEPANHILKLEGGFASPQVGATMSRGAYRVPTRATRLQLLDANGLIQEEPVHLEQGGTLRRTY